jgi:hypothetical protein
MNIHPIACTQNQFHQTALLDYKCEESTTQAALKALQSLQQNVSQTLQMLKEQQNLLEEATNWEGTFIKNWALLGGGFVALTVLTANPIFLGFGVLSGFSAIPLSIPSEALNRRAKALDHEKTGQELLIDIQNISLKAKVTPYLKKIDDLKDSVDLSAEDCTEAQNLLRDIGKCSETALLQLQMFALLKNANGQTNALTDSSDSRRDFFLEIIKPLTVWTNNTKDIDFASLETRVNNYVSAIKEFISQKQA